MTFSVLWIVLMFKSDRCGIEISHASTKCCRVAGSNQTVAGLKSTSNNRCGESHSGFKSDRCGIEMKLLLAAINLGTKFKSDRCGIEMKLLLAAINLGTKFKSDRCGIEMNVTSLCGPCRRISSNQTVAGLKYLPRVACSAAGGVQIRPLRD